MPSRWRRIWFWTLLGVFLLWFGLEMDSIAADQGHADFTLSDTIRDWEAQHHWIRWATGAVMLGLWLHFFVQRNKKGNS